jgi:hypothetical protein
MHRLILIILFWILSVSSFAPETALAARKVPISADIAVEGKRIETGFGANAQASGETYALYGLKGGVRWDLLFGKFTLSPGLGFGLFDGGYDYRVANIGSGKGTKASGLSYELFIRGAYPVRGDLDIIGLVGAEYMSIYAESKDGSPYPYREDFHIGAGDIYAGLGVSYKTTERISVEGLFRTDMTDFAVTTDYRFGADRPDSVKYSHRAVRLAVSYSF